MNNINEIIIDVMKNKAENRKPCSGKISFSLRLVGFINIQRLV